MLADRADVGHLLSPLRPYLLLDSDRDWHMVYRPTNNDILEDDVVSEPTVEEEDDDVDVLTPSRRYKYLCDRSLYR